MHGVMARALTLNMQHYRAYAATHSACLKLAQLGAYSLEKNTAVLLGKLRQLFQIGSNTIVYKITKYTVPGFEPIISVTTDRKI